MLLSLTYVAMIAFNTDVGAIVLKSVDYGLNEHIFTWRHIVPPIALGTAFYYLFYPIHNRAWIWYPVQVATHVVSLVGWWLSYSLYLYIFIRLDGWESYSYIRGFAFFFGSAIGPYLFSSLVIGAALWFLLNNHRHEPGKQKNDDLQATEVVG